MSESIPKHRTVTPPSRACATYHLGDQGLVMDEADRKRLGIDAPKPAAPAEKAAKSGKEGNS